ncbi:MAG TPA: hypothetical protein VIE89_06735 [Candidatus Binatia bacterium]|jgi:hypothetical protein
MKRRTWWGIVFGLIYGLVIFWGAAYQALQAGGSVALAASLVGFLGAIGGGGLIGLTVAMGVEEEMKEEEAKKETVAEPLVEHRAAA